MSEAYTRVVQGHVSNLVYRFPRIVLTHFSQIAIDTAIFPEGTSGYQLDSQARRPLWKDGMNYLVGVTLLLVQKKWFLMNETAWNGSRVWVVLDCA
jgi:hypothetical protein